MTWPGSKFAIQALHWTVGLVVLLESARTFYRAHAMHGAGHAGVLATVRLILSGSELIAALLFLVSATTAIGGIALLVIFALAIVIHGLHGEFQGLQMLVLYGVAVWVSLAAGKNASARRYTCS